MATIYFNDVRGTLKWGDRYNQVTNWSGGVLETTNPAFIEAAKKHPSFSSITGEVTLPAGAWRESVREGYAPASFDGDHESFGLGADAGASDETVYPTGKPPTKYVQCQKCGETMHPDEYPDHMKYHGRIKAAADYQAKKGLQKVHAKVKPAPKKSHKKQAPKVPSQGKGDFPVASLNDAAELEPVA